MCVVLAGGEGKRLAPLTDDRAKPAVPAQMRIGPRWFAGSADAIFQNLNLVHDEEPDYVCVFGADHIYRMDARQMLDHHIASGFGATVAGIPVPISQADRFGVIEATADGRRVERFHEKPSDPTGLEVPGTTDSVFASMGNYVFTTEALVDAVTTDAKDEGSVHDLGGSIMPMLTAAGDVGVYDFDRNDVPGVTEREHAYWRDVGTIDTYYDATMDLIDLDPVFNLYNEDWPILTWVPPSPPAKFVHESEGRVGKAIDSMVSSGALVSGGTVRKSVLSPGVRVHSYATVEGSVLLHDVDIGRGAVVRKAILDKNVKVPEGARIGVDLDEDRKRYRVSEGGVVVLAKGQTAEA